MGNESSSDITFSGLASQFANTNFYKNSKYIFSLISAWAVVIAMSGGQGFLYYVMTSQALESANPSVYDDNLHKTNWNNGVLVQADNFIGYNLFTSFYSYIYAPELIAILTAWNMFWTRGFKTLTEPVKEELDDSKRQTIEDKCKNSLWLTWGIINYIAGWTSIASVLIGVFGAWFIKTRDIIMPDSSLVDITLFASFFAIARAIGFAVYNHHPDKFKHSLKKGNNSFTSSILLLKDVLEKSFRWFYPFILVSILFGYFTESVQGFRIGASVLHQAINGLLHPTKAEISNYNSYLPTNIAAWISGIPAILIGLLTRTLAFEKFWDDDKRMFPAKNFTEGKAKLLTAIPAMIALILMLPLSAGNTLNTILGFGDMMPAADISNCGDNVRAGILIVCAIFAVIKTCFSDFAYNIRPAAIKANEEIPKLASELKSKVTTQSLSQMLTNCCSTLFCINPCETTNEHDLEKVPLLVNK